MKQLIKINVPMDMYAEILQKQFFTLYFFSEKVIYIHIQWKKIFFLSKNFAIQENICIIKMGWYTKNLYFYPGFFFILKIYLYSIKNKKTIFGCQIWSNFATQVRFLFEKSEVHFYKWWFWMYCIIAINRGNLIFFLAAEVGVDYKTDYFSSVGSRIKTGFTP